VPATHEAERKLPAVSGSSGRLVVEQVIDERAEPQWPGRVFEDESLDYEEAMLEFVAASSAQSPSSKVTDRSETSKDTSLKAQKRALRQEEAQLRAERRAVRQQRALEDAAWKELRAKRKQEKAIRATQSPAEGKAQDERWQVQRRQRQAILTQRQQENEQWRQKRRSLRERLAQLSPIVTAWIAILVITDNCTRQCLGLPLFVAGPKVTSEMIVEALRVLLPLELRFLITDRGTHFTAQTFKAFVRSESFIHVLIARHRPQSNGIAERFVRTLKEWLRDKSWEDDQELGVLLQQFLAEYNDRPHQGLPIPGLSPNEFANRIWLM
jgi:transposase InsO family protein